MTFTPFEVISALCLVAMLVLNLSLKSSISNLRLAVEKDLSGVRVELANLRAEVATKQSNLQVEVLKRISDGFLPRGEAEAMHESNTERLKSLQTELHALAQRVGDIG